MRGSIPRTFSFLLAVALLSCGAGLLHGDEDAPVATFDTKLEPAAIQAAIDGAYAKHKDLKEGKNADYIPALAKVDPGIFGIALVTTDGTVYTKGDIESEVSIQSISKVFTMCLVMEERGTRSIYEAMGVDATGQVFNSIVAIEQHKGHEMNPLVNAGAIAATGMVAGDTYEAIWSRVKGVHCAFAGRTQSLNHEVFDSEAATNPRNQANAMLMHANGLIEKDP